MRRAPVHECDATLIARSIDEPTVFGALFDRHAAEVQRFLVRRVGPVVADNLLGEVFRIAFERRATFEARGTGARPWLYGIAGNLVSRHHRGEARRRRAVDRVAAQPGGDDDP